MSGAYDRYDPLSGTYLPADFQKTTEAAATAAAETSADSYTVVIQMPLVANKKYKFQAAYVYKDPETGVMSEGPRSPWIEDTFVIPNLTLPVTNLILTPGIKGYGIKYDISALSEHEDIIVYESLTGAFAGEEYIVWVGTSTSLFINTSSFAPRWVKVVTRDKWLDVNRSSTTAGPITPQNADPDTSTPPSAPTGVSAVGTIDTNDKSGFSIKLTASWLANTDTNTSGYVIRWTTQNPSTTPSPIWEYGQVEGKATTTFTVTGLIPNTLYYYQVTAKSPYNAISWSSPQSGTLGPIVDANAPTDAFAQLRSILSIGGKTTDLFKIGTGIAQSINTSTTITPALTAGTYSGIILNKSTTNLGHNYWLNTGQFRVGSGTAFLYWDGSDLYTTGKINATGGSFTGDVKLNGGTLFAGTSPNTGARVRLNSEGIFAYDSFGTQTISISQADGKIDARKGYIGGWTIDGSAQTTGSIYSTNTKLESNGTLTLGDISGTLQSIVRLSASDTYRIWVGSQSSSNAAFKVHSNGTLYATGAEISGNITANSLALGTTYNGTSLTDIKNNSDKGATAIQADGASIVADAITRRITKIQGSSAMQILSGGSRPVYIDDTGLYMKNAANNQNTIFLESSTGKAYFGGELLAATGSFIGAMSAGSINISGGTGTVSDDGEGGPNTVISTVSNAISTLYSRNGVTCLGVNAMAFEAVNTGGWLSSLYPYYDGAVDLGIKSSATGLYSTYRWRNLRLTGTAYFGGDGSNNTLSTTSPTGSGQIKIAINSNGTIYANLLGTSTGTAIVQNADGFLKVSSSSRRYKENIEPISGSYLDAIKELSPVTFSYKEEFSGSANNPIVSGLIAEDVAEIEKLNGIVNYNNEGTPESISYDRLSVFLSMAINELSNKIDILSNRLDALEG